MEKNILIGIGPIKEIRRIVSGSFSSIAVLTDDNVGPVWLPAVKKAIGRKTVDIVVPAGEKSKTAETAILIWKKIVEAGLDRNSLLINLGGGMIGDLGGFAAATFMRGIDFLQIPTSLLAMVDASIGGKAAIDVGGIKNLVGVFKNPVAVIVDINMLKTLPKRELVSGFAEMIKHGIIANRSHFDRLTVKKPEEYEKGELEELIRESINIKLMVVNKDPGEKGLRKVLNFGHTAGHAVESLSLKTKKPLLHGEAVAIGMVAEARLSQLLGILPESQALVIEQAIKNAGLPTGIEGISLKELLSVINHDKKNKSGKILWSLPDKIGSVNFNIQASMPLIIKALERIII